MMQVRKYAFILVWCCCWWGNIALAQQTNNLFTVVETDTSGFPTLKVKFTVPGKKRPVETDFKVLDEGKQNLSFELSRTELSDSAGTDKNKLIFFLVEASPITKGLPLENFKKAVLRVLDRLPDGDKINVGYFGKPSDDNENVVLLNNEFSSNFALFKQDIQNKIIVRDNNKNEVKTDSTGGTSNNTKKENTASSVDVFKSLYDALDFMASQRETGRKMLILMTAAVPGKDGGGMGLQDIIEKAKRAKIPVFIITYKVNTQYNPDDFLRISDRTGGSSATAKTAFDVREAITAFVENGSSKGEEGQEAYMLTFVTEQTADGKIHQFEIQFKGSSQVINYNAPVKGGSNRGFWSNYGVFILILVGVLGAYAFYQYREQQTKRVNRVQEEEEEEMMRLEEEERRQAEEEERFKAIEEQNIMLREQIRSVQQELKDKEQMFQQNQNAGPSKYDMKKTVISGGGGAPVLMVSAGGFSQNFTLNKLKITIGRQDDNDIVIPEQTISKNHAIIHIENGSFFLTDLGSTNGTFVNGNRIDKLILKSGDIIRFGASTCKFQI